MEDAAAVDDAASEDITDDMLEAVVLASGTFEDIDSVHRGSGTATLYERRTARA